MIMTYKEDPQMFDTIPWDESETLESAIESACELIDEHTELYFAHEDDENILSVEVINCAPIEYGHPNSPNRG